MGMPQRDPLKVKEAEERIASLERYKNRKKWDDGQKNLKIESPALWLSIGLNVVLIIAILRLI